MPLLFTAHTVSGFAQGIAVVAAPWYFARNRQEVNFNLYPIVQSKVFN
jgi:hypothetical protein